MAIVHIDVNYSIVASFSRWIVSQLFGIFTAIYLDWQFVPFIIDLLEFMSSVYAHIQYSTVDGWLPSTFQTLLPIFHWDYEDDYDDHNHLCLRRSENTFVRVLFVLRKKYRYVGTEDTVGSYKFYYYNSLFSSPRWCPWDLSRSLNVCLDAKEREWKATGSYRTIPR